jgi:dTDP-glucose 4,6-dehydratase
VSDQIEGILRLAASEIHEPVNVGNPDEFTILECARLVQNVTGSHSGITYRPLPEDDPKQRRPDIAKAKQLLHWEPKVNLETGLKLSMDYFQQAVNMEKGDAGNHDLNKAAGRDLSRAA